MENDIQFIFIVGSARSGTTLITRLLYTNKNVLNYNAETLLLTVCKPKYGNIFKSQRKRKIFLNDWFKSRQFIRSGLSEKTFIKLINQSSSYTELLYLFYAEMAKENKKSIVVDGTPANARHIEDIRKVIPEAQFIWITRDGRDVAISQEKLNWVNPPYPFTSRESRLHYACAQWAYLQRIKKAYSNDHDILGVRFEDLLNDPEDAVQKITEFVSIGSESVDLTIISSGEGANSAFGKLSKASAGKTSQRWKSESQPAMARITAGTRKDLEKSGYTRGYYSFNFYPYFRYLIFCIHITLKRSVSSLPFMGRFISSSLEL